MAIPQKIKLELPYKPVIPLLEINPKELKARSQRDLYNHVHRSIIHNSQKLKAIRKSIDGWMNEQTVVYTYHKILFHLKKEWNPDIWDNVREAWGSLCCYTKRQIFYDFIYMRKSE